MLDAADFRDALSDHPQIKGICMGHIHQQFETTLNGIRVLGTPSTSIQFTPGTTMPEYDSKPPGLRVLDLGEEEFQTTVVRVPQL